MWLWPLPSNRITQMPNANHVAIDIGVPRGTPVIAPVAGTVETRPGSTGYGNHVRLHLDNGFTIFMGHLQAFTTAPGARVQAGQVIAKSGNSGNSTGPHLHLEVRDGDNRTVNPMAFFNPAALPPAELFNAPAGYIPPAMRTQAAAPGSTLTRAPMSSPYGYVSGASAAVNAAAAGAVAAQQANAKAPGLVVLNTPAGPIKLGANIKWGTLIAGVAGGALAMIGAWGLTHPTPQGKLTKDDAETILTGLAGIVNPALGVAAQIATSKSAGQATGRAVSAHKQQQGKTARAEKAAARAAKKEAAPAAAPSQES